MNTNDLLQLGVPVGEPMKLAHEFILAFRDGGGDMSQLQSEVAAGSTITGFLYSRPSPRSWRIRRSFSAKPNHFGGAAGSARRCESSILPNVPL
jgi:hypothetical protein